MLSISHKLTIEYFWHVILQKFSLCSFSQRGSFWTISATTEK